MDITTREQLYQQYRQQWQAGQLDDTAFQAAVDTLSFHDAQGVQWMMGSNSGSWYYFDGQAWQEASPYLDNVFEESQAQPERVAIAPQPTRSSWRPTIVDVVSIPLKSVMLASVALIVLLAVVWPVGSAPLLGGPAMAPSPRPPLGSGSGGGSDGSGDNGGSGSSSSTDRQSSINGVLIDSSTGLPGQGIEISVNGAIVRTDTDGSYSITALAAGSYTVEPVLLGQGVPDQGPVYVNVDGLNSVTVDLSYSSQVGPQPTDTPHPAAALAIPVALQATPPPALPEAGGAATPAPLLIVLAGFGLFFTGIVLFTWSGKDPSPSPK